MKKETFIRLINAYLQGTASASEQALLEACYRKMQSKAVAPIAEKQAQLLSAKIFGNIRKEIGQQPTRIQKTHTLWLRLSAAAAAVLLITGTIFYFNRPDKAPLKPVLVQQDLKPGGNKAYLTLSDGKRITLTDAANGQLAREAGAEITKTANGEVIYTVSQNKPGGSTLYNTIETPTGGTYQVRLPDGSKVWLNAASKLTYPLSFVSRAGRKVELSGEAYFEVAKDRRHPFKVLSRGQELEVLGTHFNLSSYADDGQTRSTLLEGAVKVNQALLKPGEQSILKAGVMSIRKADTEAAVAWKNGLFKFDNENLESIMRKVGRWYGTEVRYENESLRGVSFGGKVSRFENLSKLLKTLERTGEVRFKVKGNTITVMK